MWIFSNEVCTILTKRERLEELLIYREDSMNRNLPDDTLMPHESPFDNSNSTDFEDSFMKDNIPAFGKVMFCLIGEYVILTLKN